MKITTLLNKDLKRNDRFNIDNPDLRINVYPDEVKLNRLDENRNAFLTNSNEIVEIY